VGEITRRYPNQIREQVERGKNWEIKITILAADVQLIVIGKFKVFGTFLTDLIQSNNALCICTTNPLFS